MPTAVSGLGFDVFVRKSGNLLEVSLGPDAPPLPASLRSLIEPKLQYVHKQFLYGAAAWDPVTETRQRMRFETRQMFRYDVLGRLVCSFGFVKRIVDLLRAAGCRIHYFDCDKGKTPPPVPPDKSLVAKHFAYKARQEECLDKMLASPCGIIHAVTGFGKMALINMMVLAHPKAVIDVVVRRRALAVKLRQYLLRSVPNVGLVGDGSKDRQRVTVYTAASLHRATPYESEILLGDECHELVAEECSAVLAQYRRSRNFGFSASIQGRSDGTDLRMEGVFGPVIFHMPYWEAVELGLVVPIQVRWYDVCLSVNPCAKAKTETARLRAGLWRNEARNQAIADCVRSFRPEDQVLVLVDKVEHAVHLRRHLPECELVYAPGEVEKGARYVAEGLMRPDECRMEAARADRMRIAFEAGEIKRVIATGVWSVGVDPVQLVGLVRGAGGSSEIMDVQAPGRASRTSDGKEVGIVCDFADQFDSQFKSAALRRKSHYKAMRWEQFAVAPAGLRPLAR